MPKSLTQTLDDPEFRKLKPDTQKAVLKKLGVSDDMQGKLLAKIAAPTTATTPAPAQPSFLSRVNTRVGGQLESMSKTIGTGLKDLFEGTAFSGEPGTQAKEVREMTSTPVGLMTVGPQMVAKQVGGMVKDWASDPANLAGDVLMGEMLGGGRVPEVPELAERTTKRAAKVEPTVPEHLRGLSKEQRVKYQEKVTKAAEEHQQKLADHAAKQEAERGINVATRDAQNNIMSTHRTVRSALDDRWDTLRDGVKGPDGERIPGTGMKGRLVSNPADIYNGVRAAEQEHLRGAPQSLQQFRNLVKELGIEDFVENEDGTLSATDTGTGKPLDWETARVHYTAIGDKLAAGGLPGNVYQALKSVSGMLDKKLKETAALAGREHEYTALKADWSEYMNDWKDMSAVSRGGSPLARMLNTPDAGYARLHITGPAGERLLRTLEKYRSQGAQPELVGRVRNLHTESKLPRPKNVPIPKPEPKPLSPMTRAGIRVGGHMAGLAAGSALQHPFLGWGAGGTLAEASIRALEKKRAAEAAEIAGQ